MSTAGDSESVASDQQLLFQQLQALIGQHTLHAEQALIQTWIQQLNIEPIQCAAALLNMQQVGKLPKPVVVVSASAVSKPPRSVKHRLVRYRLDVGSQHQVTREQLQALLIQESGVDRKRIGRIDIRDLHTVVELPDGMPADIFQILFETTLAGRQLAIKRIKPNRRFKSKEHSQ